MSAIQKRIVKELCQGTTLSVKNMWLIRCSNISREIIRQFEEPFNITLDRKKIEWKDEFSNGWYFEYSLNYEDLWQLEKIYKKLFAVND